MNWYEQLPDNCPPLEVTPAEDTFFRLGGIPPDDSDFWSHRRRFPHKLFKVSECIALSLSIFDNLEATQRLKQLVPAMRSKSIFQLELNPDDGLIQQTGNDEHHFSWWRSTAFDLETIKILDL